MPRTYPTIGKTNFVLFSIRNRDVGQIPPKVGEVLRVSCLKGISYKTILRMIYLHCGYFYQKIQQVFHQFTCSKTTWTINFIIEHTHTHTHTHTHIYISNTCNIFHQCTCIEKVLSVGTRARASTKKICICANTCTNNIRSSIFSWVLEFLKHI